MDILASLQALNPDAEIWWDSSPLGLRSWAARTASEATFENAASWRRQLARLRVGPWPGSGLIRGSTTNPSLCLQAIQEDPGYWLPAISSLHAANPARTVAEVYWLTYERLVTESAAVLLPLWESSGGRYGWLSAQVDPRQLYDASAMVEQGLSLVRLAPNVMVKVPGSREGYEAIEELTARGVSTNNTLCFTVPQAVRYLGAVDAGLGQASRAGVDLSRWRSVITHMTGRFGAAGELAEQADRRGIRLSEADVRGAEVAVFKRIYRLIERGRHPVKLLLSSMRVSVDGDGARCWHLTESAGGDVVYTCPPTFLRAILEQSDDLAPVTAPRMRETVDPSLLDKLNRLPYFVSAYEPTGLSPDEFNHHPALLQTALEFTAQTGRLVDLVDTCSHGSRDGLDQLPLALPSL